MIYAERVCACGCDRRFWPHRSDQRYSGPWCRAAAWRRTHPTEHRYERLGDRLRTDAAVDRPEAFSDARSAV